jgi:hypothetical protein
LLGTATLTAGSYNYSWTSVAAGAYTVTAVATDNNGATTTSSAISFRVNAPPTVSITSPANNAVITYPGTVTLTATASDTDGTISQVQFYNGATLLGTGTLSAGSYSYSWISLAAGTYTVTAVATDSDGATTTSSAVTFRVNAPPTVSITSPANNAVITYPGTVTLTATANDTDGTISQVQFFNGTTLLGTGTPSVVNSLTRVAAGIRRPDNGYSYSWTGLAAGTYTVTAVATDSDGATTTSSAVTFRVNAPPTVAITSPANNAVITYPGTVTLTATASDTDGTISLVQFYNGATLLGTATLSAGSYSYSWTSLAADTYTVTAVATDSDGATTTSSPITFRVNAPPTVAITSPANNAVITYPGTVTLTATASDTDGTISQVQFYNGATLLGTGTLSAGSYSYSWTGVAAGTYTVTAVATDSDAATTTSSALTFRVNAPPTVSITSPANNAAFNLPGAVTITATADDSDGTISQVQIFNGATLLGTATDPPAMDSYSYIWSNPAAGSYTLTAVATDSDGATTTSAPITLNVYSAPTITLGANIAIDQTGSPLPASYTAWATGITAGAGPGAASQAVTIACTPDHPEYFTVAPSIDPATGNLTFTQAIGAWGTTTVTVVTSGINSLQVTNTFTITINQVLVTTSGTLTTSLGVIKQGQLQATDYSTDPLNYAVISNPTLGKISFNASTGAYTYTPTSKVPGTDSFTYKVTDTVNNLTVQGTISIILNAKVSKVTLTASPISPVLQGTSITLTAVPVSGGEVEYQYRVLDIAKNSTTLSSFSDSSSYICDTTTLAPGTYTFAVDVREKNALPIAPAITVPIVTGTCAMKLETLTKTSSVELTTPGYPSGQIASGTLSIPLTATVSGANPGAVGVQYTFTARNITTNVTTTLQTNGVSAVYQWTPTPGIYTLSVKAHDPIGNLTTLAFNISNYVVYSTALTSTTGVTLSSTLASPQAISPATRTAIIPLTALVTDGDGSTVQYKFFAVQTDVTPNKTYTIQALSPSTTANWTVTIAGTYNIIVTAKDMVSGVVATSAPIASFVVYKPGLTATSTASLTVSPTSGKVATLVAPLSVTLTGKITAGFGTGVVYTFQALNNLPGSTPLTLTTNTQTTLTSATATWEATPGYYTLSVTAYDPVSNITTPAATIANYLVYSPALTSINGVAWKFLPTTVVHGNPVTITPSMVLNCGTGDGLLYSFQAVTGGVTTTPLTTPTTSVPLSWTPTSAGVYTLTLYAQDPLSGFQTTKTVSYTVK